jgi:hypothetical protein
MWLNIHSFTATSIGTSKNRLPTVPVPSTSCRFTPSTLNKDHNRQCIRFPLRICLFYSWYRQVLPAEVSRPFCQSLQENGDMIPQNRPNHYVSHIPDHYLQQADGTRHEQSIQLHETADTVVRLAS